MNELTNANEVTMTSLEVVELVNKLRVEEGNKKEKRHSDFMTSIRTELETLEKIGINFNERNISLGSYIDKQNQKRPCYIMDKQFIMQMLNKESAYVRYKTQQYIEALEKKLKDMSIPSYQIEDSIARAERWICEEKERQRLSIENTKLIDENKSLKDEIEELEEYKKIKEMVNNTNDELMLLGQLGQYLKSNTGLKTGQKLIFKYAKENNLVKYEYKENYATAHAVNNGYLKNVCEYVVTKRGMMPVNKIYVSKKGVLYISKKLFEQQLKEQLDK